MRLALRGFVKAPVFTAVAVLSLALAIGANTALFGRGPDHPAHAAGERPQELVQFRVEGGRVGNNTGDGVETFSHPLVSWPFATGAGQSSGLTGHRAERVSLVGDDRSEMVERGAGRRQLLRVFGVRPPARTAVSAPRRRGPKRRRRRRAPARLLADALLRRSARWSAGRCA